MTEPVLTWRDRQDRIEARGDEYRAGAMTDEQFRAYLFGMRQRGEDIRHTMNEYAPPAPGPTFEDRRLESSRQWMKSYVNRITESRNRELEKAIQRFVDCGVTLDRMHIVDSRNFDTSTLLVDGVARFQWKLKGPDYGRQHP